MRAVVPVILCGGEGARLWPVSRGDWPKIFIEMPDGRSLLKQAFERAGQFATEKFILAVTNEAYAFRVREQFGISETQVIQIGTIMEPVPRNTGPAIATAARFIAQKFGPDTILLCLPADHIIRDDDEFAGAINEGVTLAERGCVTLFGLPPSSANTSYGYIQISGNEVERFVEKPDAKTAQSFASSAKFLWNSGIVAARAGVLLDIFGTHAAQILERTDSALEKAENIVIEGRLHLSLPLENYRRCENISFDHAVLEKSKNLRVIEANFNWQDIGTWQSYGSLHPRDENGNHINGDAILIDTKNSIIHAKGRTIGISGLENVIVVETEDVILVADARNDEHIRGLQEAVKKRHLKNNIPAPTSKSE